MLPSFCSSLTRRLLASGALIGVALVAPSKVSSAAEPSEKEKEAQKLFVEGRSALERGEHEIACVKFRGSLALFPVANTRANVAQCEEREGHLVEALKAWKDLLPELPDGDARRAAALEKVAALEVKIPQLRITLSAATPENARVLVDGAVVERAKLASPLLLLRGTHTIVLEIPGQKDESLSVTLSDGERAEKKMGPTPPAAPPTQSVSTGPIVPPPPPSNTLRTAAFVSGGVGIAAAIAAGVTGGMIVGADGDIQKECAQTSPGGNKLCTDKGLQLIRDGEPVRIVNGVMWGVGLAGLGAGVILFLVSGKSKPQAASVLPVVSPQSGGLLLMGKF